MTTETAGSLVSLDVPIESPPDVRRRVARRVDEVLGCTRPRWDPAAVRARATEMLGLCDEVERLTGERDAAWDEVERLRALCREAHAALGGVADVLVAEGCSCSCGHDMEGHDETCERCEMCLVDAHVSVPLLYRLRAAGGDP